MAIAITEPVVEVASTSNTTSYALSAFTPTNSSYLVAFAFATGTVATGSMTGGSLNWVQLGRIAYNAGADTAYVFGAQVPSSAASTTVTFSCTGDAATGCLLMCFQVTGHNQAAPIAQVIPNSGTAANPSFTLNRNQNTNNGYMAGYGINRSAPASTNPNGSWTEICDTGYTSPAAGGVGAFRAGGETGSTVTFTAASGNWGGFFVEVNEAAVGGPPNALASHTHLQAVQRAAFR